MRGRGAPAGRVDGPGEAARLVFGGAAAAEDPMLVFNLTDQVRETIQSTLYTLLMQRRSVFY